MKIFVGQPGSFVVTGPIKDSTRILNFNIQGNQKEVTVMVKDILKKLGDISETEPLNIYYEG